MARWYLALLSAGLFLACGRFSYDPVASPDAATDAGDATPPNDTAVLDTTVLDSLIPDVPDVGTDAGGDIRMGLVFELDFEVTATTDGSGGGHDARCVGGCPAVEAGGVVGNALRLSGGGEHLRVDDDGSFDLSAGFTVATWASHDRDAGRTCLISKPLGTMAADSFALCSDGDGPFLYVCSGCEFLRSGLRVGFGPWYHVAATHDGTTQRLYVDGTEVATRSGSVDFDMSTLVIGGDEDTGAFEFGLVGRLDEVRIYDRALSPAEIARLATP